VTRRIETPIAAARPHIFEPSLGSRPPQVASKSAEVDGRTGRFGGTQRWSQTYAGLFGNALFYGIFGLSAALGWESLPLRQVAI
jgi:hypothetical protein